jgi:hypothetical protein
MLKACVPLANAAGSCGQIVPNGTGHLESEAVVYGKSDPRPNLSANGATKEEVAILCD